MIQVSERGITVPQEGLPRRDFLVQTGRATGVLAGVVLLDRLNQHTAEATYYPTPENPARPGTIVREGNLDSRRITLQIHDFIWPNDEQAGEIWHKFLMKLRKLGARAIFAPTGAAVAAHPDLVRETLADGNEIADHSWTHRRFTELSRRDKVEEIMTTHDEIEKANTALHNLLLNIIDKAELRLPNGQVTRFNNSVILMTSNIGNQEIARLVGDKKMGFERDSGGERDLNKKIYTAAERAARNRFAPEFLGRLNRISVFRPLSLAVLMEIFDVEIKRFQKEILGVFPVILLVEPEVRAFIVKEATDKKEEGAHRLPLFIMLNYMVELTVERFDGLLATAGGG